VATFSTHPLTRRFLKLAATVSLLLPTVAAARTVLRLAEPAAMFTKTGALRCKPDGLWFGNVGVGTSKTLSGTLTNAGAVEITVIAVNQASRFFSVSGISLPLALAPGAQAPFTVTFTPEASGRTDDSLGFVSDASSAVLYMTLHGVGFYPGALTPSPASIGFGSVPVGQGLSQTEVLTNTGTTRLTVSQVSVSGGFTSSAVTLPFTLSAGQSMQLTLGYNAQTAGPASGNLTVVSNAINPSLTIPLSATATSAGNLQPVAPSLNFGSVNVGATSSKMESLTNSGGANVTISQASVSGSGFSLSGLPLPVILTPGQSYTFPVVFSPSAGGNASRSLTVASDASDASLSISLAGTGLAPGQLILSPAAIDFGNVTVGQTKSMGASLLANGANVTISAAAMTSSEFKLTGLSLPLTIAAGQSVSLNLLFAPASSGAVAANLSLTSNAANSVAETLSGNGIAPLSHAVTLSWTESSSGTTGFNIYRATVSGGPYTRLNSSLSTGSSYTDSSVSAGSTYFYVTTALNSSGVESKYSNEARAAVPNP